jgi:copper chaperone
VIVKTAIPYDDILAKIKKTGKEVRGGEVVAAA